MKVTKFIDIQQEIEVEISAEDVVSAISEDPNSKITCMTGINNVSKFLTAVPESVINEMHNSTKKIIYDYFIEQANRFKPLDIT